MDEGMMASIYLLKVEAKGRECVEPEPEPKPEEIQFYGQATKGVRWMPWCQEAMKDVASCDKLRGAAKQA
jgi:hypothetical protein